MKTLIKPFVLLLVIISVTITPVMSIEVLIDPSDSVSSDNELAGDNGISLRTNGASIFFEDFEGGEGDWWSDQGIWEVGTPTSGPGGAYSGTQCAATILNGNYPYGPDSRLVSRAIRLSEVAAGEEILLRFRQWWSYSSADKGEVQIDTFDEANGIWLETWETLKDVYSYDATWHDGLVDLTAYAGQRVRIAFYHTDKTEDPAGIVHHYESAGWYIDDVQITRQRIPQFRGFEDFESGWDGWWCDRGIWEVGTPMSGPGGAYSGAQCVATLLNNSYPYGPDSRLVSPPIQLPEVAAGEEILLRFRQWWSYAAADRGEVQIDTYDESNGIWLEAWDPQYYVNSQSSVWHRARVPLTQYAGQRIRIGFFHTDVTEDPAGIVHHYESAGWYIDDVEITPWPQGPRLTGWSLMDDTGLDANDKVTCDTTPVLTYEFSEVVDGNDVDIQINAPDGLPIVPDLISGWGTDTIVAIFTTPLPLDGQYTVTLKKTINDGLGGYLNDGEDEVLFFTLDTTPPALEVDDWVSVSLGSVQHDNNTEQTSAQITITNISSTIIQGPMWLTLKTIGDPEIALLDSHGTMTDGYQYIDITGLLIDGQLDPDESVAKRLFFNNPLRQPFILQCHILAESLL